MPSNLIPQFGFADGVLLVDTPVAKMRIRWNPAPVAEELTPANKTYQPFWPDFRLIRPYTEESAERSARDRIVHHPEYSDRLESKEDAFSAFRKEIPDHIAKVVSPFLSHQWPLMALLHAQPSAMDLATSNPALACCVANNNEFRRTKVKVAAIQAVSYAPRKQRDIAKWLGFPDSEAVVKILKRVPPESASPGVMRMLRSVLSECPDIMKLLGHLQIINEEVIELIGPWRVRELVTSKLLHEVSKNTDGADVVRPADIILASLAILNEMKDERKLRPFQSITQIHSLQAKVDADYLQWQDQLRRLAEVRRQRQEQQRVRLGEARLERGSLPRRNSGRQPFPKPPLPGTDSIVPITSWVELESEGAEQRNCVVTKAQSILAGRYFVYRVMKPERATLAISYYPSGSWYRSELRAAGNQKVGKETIRMVDFWLRAHSLSI